MSETSTSVQAMNKIMFFMANCGFYEVKDICYSVFDSKLADHIFDKYLVKVERTRMAFFDIYFELDSDCKRAICKYIDEKFTGYQKI
jgi:hypothetical protein